MKIEVKDKREVPLLSRMRVSANITFDNETPSRDKIRKELAKILNLDENLTIIKHIYTRFGRKEAKVIANVYKTVEDAKRTEEEHVVRKHFKEEKKAEVAEAPAEAKAE